MGMTLWEFILNQIVIWLESRLSLAPMPHKKAIIVGSNYFGDYALNGCLNDCVNIHNLLTGVFSFNDQRITKIDDNNIKPTKENITREFKQMLSLANDGDILFFHFSGHGFQIKIDDTKETDGYDEVIVTNEGDSLESIGDNDLKQMINDNLKSDATIFMLFDSCHSGTVMDLKWNYDITTGEFVENVNDVEIQMPGNVIMFGSCQENQLSADFYVDYQNQGILSYEFIKCIRQNPNISLANLLKQLQANMGKSQTPQLLCNSKIDVNKPFLS
jgi:hypothetical protein